MRVGSISYATRQGIGWLPKWFYDAGVITDMVIFHHGPQRRDHIEWYPPDTPIIASRPFNAHQCVLDLIKKVDVMLWFETPFDWSILPYCKAYGVKTVIVPMYECTPENIPYQPDKWICPSLLDCEYFPNSPFLEIPVNPTPWKLRTQAKRFLHNGGHLGLRGHKGTLEILQAMKYVKSPIELKVTSQDIPGLNRILQQVPEIKDDDRVMIDTSDKPYGDLFPEDYDVFIMAEKYNGLSLPLREAYAYGMVTMTSNRFPMNTWLPTWPLIEVHGYQKARVSGGYKEYDEAIIKPENIAQAIDHVYGDVRYAIASEAGRYWAENNSWQNLKPQWMKEIESA